MFVLGNGSTTHLKKNRFSILLRRPRAQARARPPGPGPGPCEEGWKIYISGFLFAIFGRASGQIFKKNRVLARQGDAVRPGSRDQVGG